MIGTQSRLTPWVNRAMLLANVVLFAVELRQGGALDDFLRRWGVVPADVSGAFAPGGEAASLITLVTASFLHIGWLHLIVNMLYLSVFGSAVEGALGHGRYLAVYLAASVAGGLVHVLVQPGAQAPAVGASGAIAGVMGAHLALFPGATLGTLAPVLFFSPAANVSALLLLLLWLVAQVFVGVAGITEAIGTAWWAHLGGFVCGLVLAPLIRSRRRRW